MIDFILLVAYGAAFVAGIMVGGTYGGIKGLVTEVKLKLKEWAS